MNPGENARSMVRHMTDDELRAAAARNGPETQFGRMVRAAARIRGIDADSPPEGGGNTEGNTSQ